MKKKLTLCLLVAMATISATALSLAPSKQCSETNVNAPTEVQGRGRCTYGTCKCPAFKQRPGYYQCWCGHQSFVHK